MQTSHLPKNSQHRHPRESGDPVAFRPDCNLLNVIETISGSF